MSKKFLPGRMRLVELSGGRVVLQVVAAVAYAAAAATWFALTPLAGAAIGDAPEVTVPVVSNITTTGADFQADVNANGLETQVQFQHQEPGDTEWQVTSFAELSGTEPVTTPGDFEGTGDLEANTEYLIRVVATNDTGTTESAPTSFTTLPPLPPVSGVPTAVEITNDVATFEAELDPNGSDTSYRFEYQEVGSPDWIPVPESDLPGGDSTEPIVVGRRVTGLEAETEYAVRLVSTNAHGGHTSGESTFETAEAAAPIVSTPGLTDVAATSARLTGVVDPNGEEGATYHFEYRGAADVDWISVPVPDGSFSGTAPTTVAESVSGLGPSTGYVVRLVATGPGGTATSDARGFTTRAADAPTIPARKFEQVSPRDKQDSDLIPGQGFVLPSTDGDGVAFASFGQGAFAGSPTTAATYLVERGDDAWTTKAIAPVAAPAVPPFFLQFTPDLTRGLMAAADPPAVAPGDNPGVIDLFMRDNETDEFELVTSQPTSQGPSGFSAIDPDFAWASRDLAHILFSTRDGTTYVPGAPEAAAYYSDGSTVSVASIQPGSLDPFPQAGAGAGLELEGNTRAISEHGRRIFFSAPRSATTTEPIDGAQLYVRKDHGAPDAETVQVSAPEAGVTDPNGTWAAFFRGASTDGSKAFFTSCQKLTSDATADATGGEVGRCRYEPGGTKSDLYLYDLDANGGDGDLVSLTTADPVGADVTGVVGINEAGSRVYFVARGKLAAAAIAGRPNLYLWENGGGITHIATLAESDTRLWVDPIKWDKESRITSDGETLAFASHEQLTAFDNAGTSQVYLYSTTRPGQLLCASCAEGAGAHDATIRNQSKGTDNRSALAERRNLVADGSRVFFETAAPLTASDTNNRLDVYEYDVAAGRAALVSSGRSVYPSHFAGATADGANVFFWTRERLVGWDQDDLNDIYDARIGGGQPEPPRGEEPCGLDCQPPPPEPPALTDPGSSELDGAGNVALPPRASFAPRRLSAAARARLARTGRATLSVRVNRAGKVTMVARAKVGGRSRIVARSSRTARRKGTVKVPIRLSKIAGHALRRNGSLQLVIRVRFTGSLEPRQLRAALKSGKGKGR